MSSADAEDVGLRGDMDADDLVLGFDLAVVGDVLGPDLRFIIADGYVRPEGGTEGDDLLLVLFEGRDEIGLGPRPAS